MKDKFFVMNRKDGLGAKLFSMVNTLYLADRLGGGDLNHAKFLWNEERYAQNNKENASTRFNDGKVIGMSVERKEQVFSQDFINKHYLASLSGGKVYDKLSQASVRSWEIFKNDFLNLDYDFYTVETGSLGIVLKDMDLEDYRANFKKYFEMIDFAPRLKEMIAMAHKKADEIGEYDVIHIRTGDGVYPSHGNHRLFSFYALWMCIPSELALGVVQRNKDKKFFIVGDDTEGVDEFVKVANSKNVQSVNSLRNINEYSNLELCIFDIIFLSRAKALYGGESSLARLGSFINNTQTQNLHRIFSTEKKYEIFKENYPKLSKLSPYQRAFSSFHMFYIARELQRPLDEQILLLKEGLRNDKDNDRLSAYLIDCYIQKGDLEEAEKLAKEMVLTQKLNHILRIEQYGALKGMSQNYAKAQSVFRPYISFIAAKLYEKQNDFVHAMFALKKSLKSLGEEVMLKEFYEQLLPKYHENIDKAYEELEAEFFSIKQEKASCIEKNKKLIQENQNLIKKFEDLPRQIKEQELNIKKLKVKKLEKELGLKLSKLEPRIVLNLNENIRRSAVARIRNYLAYRLGAAIIICNKSFLGLCSLPFILSFIKAQYKKERKTYETLIKQNSYLKLPNIETYPDYTAALKEKECFTYKLGEAMIRADKEWYKGGYLKFYFEAKRLEKEFKQKEKS